MCASRPREAKRAATLRASRNERHRVHSGASAVCRLVQTEYSRRVDALRGRAFLEIRTGGRYSLVELGIEVQRSVLVARVDKRPAHCNRVVSLFVKSIRESEPRSDGFDSDEAELMVPKHQPRKSRPTHPLWLLTSCVKDAMGPSKPGSDSLGLPHRTEACIFARARVRKIATLSAAVHAAVVVEDRHTAPASRSGAYEPGSRAAKVARSSLNPHRMTFLPPNFPISARLAHEHHVFQFGTSPQGSHGFAIARPPPSAERTRSEHSTARQAPDVNCATILGARLTCTAMTLTFLSRGAHEAGS